MLWEKLLGQIVHKTSEKNTEMWVENDVIKQICTAYYLEMKVIWNKDLEAVNMWFIKKNQLCCCKNYRFLYHKDILYENWTQYMRNTVYRRNL